jgi:hypothetical protein
VDRLLRDIHRNVQAGTVRSLPTPTSIVNVDTCFFVDGMSVPADTWYEFVLPSPPDDTGRRIFFIFRILVSYQQTTWFFGDGTQSNGSNAALPDPCRGQGGQRQMTHRYSRYSPATEPFQVHASEHYDLQAWVVWADTAGTHEVAADTGGINGFDVDTPTTPVRVLQEEGVPIG